ncbi:MAG: 3-methyl-2-oxobutanoate hydroxymethyltransferase [Flavobacteriales bacterium]|nr:3-methyl-2-oxobutanoate hydroxymethyltransferase [Flavobacteriales bacterium]
MSVLNNFKKLKAEGKKLVVVTSYDYWSAKILNETDVNGILIGDCSAMVMHGHEDTLNSDVETIAMHTRAVRKGAKDKFLIAAMPFMSNRKGMKETMDNVEILIKAGANALKIEGVDGNEELYAHLSSSGIPAIGHIGLTPSHHNMLGGFKVQGKSYDEELEIVEQAKKLEALGCIAIVLEAVPQHVGAAVRDAVAIPVVGVGAGIEVDGQALVLQDMLGFSTDFKPKFVRTYMYGADLIKDAVNQFAADVHAEAFPGAKETYAPAKQQLLKVA